MDSGFKKASNGNAWHLSVGLCKSAPRSIFADYVEGETA